MIKREIEKLIESRFFKDKAIILLGPMHSGKTTLIEYILSKREEKILRLNSDDSDVRELLTEPSFTKMKNICSEHKIVLIEEAQRITNIGLTIKIMVDSLKDVQVIATGSTTFDLNSKINEPMTGRKFEFMLFPLSFGEMCEEHGIPEEKMQIENRLVFGSYPEIVTKPLESQELLKHLVGSYLFKDLLLLEQINKTVLLEKIIKFLALQLGKEVKYNEVGEFVGADPLTVEKYIDLLEKAFIVFRLPSLRLKVRNEIKKGKKIYFYDNGIRNAIIGDFNNLTERNDAGVLFENYLISERMKLLSNQRLFVSNYFWRTTLNQEIDYIEESGGSYRAYEFKWNPTAKAKFSKTFTGKYPVTLQKVINIDNLNEFLLTGFSDLKKPGI